MKRTRLVLIVTIVAMILTATLAVGFGAGTPGSEDDPIVTKSYVDEAIEGLKALFNDKLGEQKETVEKLQKDVNTLKEEKGTASGTSTGWEVVRVSANTKVVGETGTEMILRSGSATAVDNGKNGISDLTGGKDLRMGTNITQNHLLLIPGSDGRGIKTVGECFVMINGGYSLVDLNAPATPNPSEMPEGI